MKIKSGLAFHCHHDQLYEFVYDYDERVRFIKANKPQKEQELRLRLFKLIPLELVHSKDNKEYQAFIKTGEARDKAWEASDKAWEAYNNRGKRGKFTIAKEALNKAWEVYNKAWEAYGKAREAYNKKWRVKITSLHEELCPNCPWDGKTIFPAIENK